MRYIKMMVGCVLLHFFSHAQNVGIGSPLPQGRLQINGNSVNAPHLLIVDSGTSRAGRVEFRNLNRPNRYIRMEGASLNSSSASSFLDIITDSVEVATFAGTGRVGIGVLNPREKVDVAGNIRMTGQVLPNGNAGASGQVLGINGSGQMQWMDLEKFQNFRCFRFAGSGFNTAHTFTVPAGVTEVGVEMWGGGGASSTTSGAGSGGYLRARIPVTPGSTLSITVGAGGGCSGCIGSSGQNSTVAFTNILLTASGGNNAGFTTSRGSFTASGSNIGVVSFYGIQGSSATIAETLYENSPVGYFIWLRNGPGKDAPMRAGTGGPGGWRRTNWDGSSPVTNSGSDGSEPGGGGGFPDGIGGNGQVIIYY